MRKLISAFILCGAQCAIAQTTPYEGQWTARFTVGGQPREAKVIFQGMGGSWQTLYLPQGADICARLESPIEITRASPTEIEFLARRSKALAGCTDGSPVVFKRIDDKTLEGTLSSGISVRIER